jgi:hypothetical protein
METIDYVAIVGAVTGTVGAIWHLRNYWYDRPRIRVTLTHALGFGGMERYGRMIAMKAVNTSKRRIYLEGAGLDIEGGQHIPFVNGTIGLSQPPLGTWLEGNSSHTLYWFLDPLLEGLIEQNGRLPPRYAWFRDATDNKYGTPVDPKLFFVKPAE